MDVTLEHEQPEPLRVENDTAGAEFCRGYVDAYQARGKNPPKKHQLSYWQGYVSGLEARLHNFQTTL